MSFLAESFRSGNTFVTKTMLVEALKTGNPLLDAVITTVVLGIFSYIVNVLCDYKHAFKEAVDTLNRWKGYIWRLNTISIEGESSSLVSAYSSYLNVSSVYSNRFLALSRCILENMKDKHSTIRSIKETYTNLGTNGHENSGSLDMFMVTQKHPFYLNRDIFVTSLVTTTEREGGDGDREKGFNAKVETVRINVCSYTLSLTELLAFVDRTTQQYLESIRGARSNQRFVYLLDNVNDKKGDCYREDVFESHRTFDNTFFDGKAEILQNIRHFLHGEEWYKSKGIPYTLGIGLHGPPGTGKTSFIKALANLTKRHVVVISLKDITTKSQLERVFFESTYNKRNTKGDIGFRKKIIVFEDIDCIGKIVRRRKPAKHVPTKQASSEDSSDSNVDDSDEESDTIDTNDQQNKLLTKIASAVSAVSKQKDVLCSEYFRKDAITLDDILNLWDGIRETPGRIMVLTSNHYGKLDPALVRPGRIDITHEMSYASREVVSGVFQHLFGIVPPAEDVERVQDKFYSPAELVNLYVANRDPRKYLERLQENKRIATVC